MKDNRVRATRPRAGAYVTESDFCGLFKDKMESLYGLSLLLTGSHQKAEQCFVSALHECRRSNAVFQDFASPWARRAVIKNAIRMVRPAAEGEAGRQPQTVAGEMHPAASPLLRMASFDCFVFVMSVLEGYGLRECALLLSARLQEVAAARDRALQALADAGNQALPALYAAGIAQPAEFSLNVA